MGLLALSLSLSLLSPSPFIPEEYSSWVTSRDGENLSCFYLVGNLTEIPTQKCVFLLVFFFPIKKLSIFYFPFRKQTNKIASLEYGGSELNSTKSPSSICARVAELFHFPPWQVQERFAVSRDVLKGSNCTRTSWRSLYLAAGELVPYLVLLLW